MILSNLLFMVQIEMCNRQEEMLPNGWAVDSDGKVVTYSFFEFYKIQFIQYIETNEAIRLPSPNEFFSLFPVGCSGNERWFESYGWWTHASWWWRVYKQELASFYLSQKSDARIVIFAVRLAYYTMLKSWSLMKVKE